MDNRFQAANAPNAEYMISPPFMGPKAMRGGLVPNDFGRLSLGAGNEKKLLDSESAFTPNVERHPTHRC